MLPVLLALAYLGIGYVAWILALLILGYVDKPILGPRLFALPLPLILKLPMAPPVVTDAAGKRWFTSDILGNCVLVSLLVMAPFALLAWLKLRERTAKMLDASAGS
jgi:hypothetical protein